MLLGRQFSHFSMKLLQGGTNERQKMDLIE